jgi:hypothetical protein
LLADDRPQQRRMAAWADSRRWVAGARNRPGEGLFAAGQGIERLAQPFSGQGQGRFLA